MKSGRDNLARVTKKPFSHSSDPKKKWIIRWPSDQPGKARKEKRFETEAAADRFKRQKEIELTNNGRKLTAMGDREKADVLYALDQLAPYPVSLRDVVDQFIEREESRQSSILISEAFEDFLSMKQGADRSPRYLETLKQRVGKFADDYGHLSMAEVDVEGTDLWLLELNVAGRTQNSYRAALSSFFSWGAKRGYCPTNPVQQTEIASEKKDKVEIFEPSDFRLILDSAPIELVPFHAIGAFSGLRTVEIEAMTWEDVDWEHNRIDVHSHGAKGSRHRYVPINDTLQAWLKPFSGSEGMIKATDHKRKAQTFRSQLRDGEYGRSIPWVHNGMRHSFASYAFAKTGDSGKVASWLGHADTKMLYTNYRERVTPEAAESWFSILPPKDFNPA